MMRKAIQLSLVVFLLLQSCTWGAYTEFAARSGGSNLNAGTRTGNSTEPGTAASFTYASGSWVAATGVFTVASGNPATDGVAVGDFCSVYADGSTVTGFVGRVTARDATTITASLTAKAGTAPTDGTNNRTLKIGGAWAGPNGAVNFPFGFVQNTLTNSDGHFPRVNFKNDAPYSISVQVAHANAGPIVWQGYATAYGDGLDNKANKFTLDAGGGNFVILAISGDNNTLADAIVTNNGTGTVAGISLSGDEINAARVVVHTVRASGFTMASNNGSLEECEAYNCNLANSITNAGFLISDVGVEVIRCISHDHTTANGVGYRSAFDATYVSSIADTCAGGGWIISSTTGGSSLLNCDAYNNTGAGVELTNTTAALFRFENCNFIKNGGWGINGSGAGPRNGFIRNCAFGSGTQANTSGTVNPAGLSGMVESGTVNYASNVTPWVDPANGDFDINLAAAQFAGRGSFTQTAASYAGTLSTPNIGASQHNPGTVPAVGDVRSGVAVGSGTGTLTLPTISQVLLGTSYGAGGTEFTGTLSAASEKSFTFVGN